MKAKVIRKYRLSGTMIGYLQKMYAGRHDTIVAIPDGTAFALCRKNLVFRVGKSNHSWSDWELTPLGREVCDLLFTPEGG
jgi:hypothetical protein